MTTGRDIAQHARRPGAAAWLAIAALGLAGCPADRPATPSPVTLVVSGDTAGWIVPCGCTSNQSGGLPRRGTFVKQHEERGGLLLVDAGGAPGGVSDYDRAKFEAILAGEQQMGVVAHNIGAAEAKLGAEYLRKVRARGAPLVSCNVRDKVGELVGAGDLVHEVAGQRVALLGVLGEAYEADGIRIEPMREAILAALGDLAGKYDRVVVLAYVSQDELHALAADLPEVDAIVGGPTGQSVAPRLVGPTLIASATNKGKFLAHLVIPAAGSPDALAGEIVEMDETYSDDAAQQENLRRFYKALAESDFTPSQTPFAPALPADPPADFAVAGSSTCRDCHAGEHAAWEASGHAHAWDSLAKSGAHVDADCQRCHTTSYGLPGGFVSARRSPQRVAVGCESCHGPSLAHVQEPHEPTAYFGQAAGQCVKCHDRENSPAFAYAEYWERIQHGEPRSKAKP